MNSKDSLSSCATTLALLIAVAGAPEQTPLALASPDRFGARADGGHPGTGPVQDAAGNLSDTTSDGGTGAVGTGFAPAPELRTERVFLRGQRPSHSKTAVSRIGFGSVCRKAASVFRLFSVEASAVNQTSNLPSIRIL